MLLGYLARGHNGTNHFLTEPKNPRKQLLAKYGVRSARKVYLDTKQGGTKHIGYIVGREWFTVYEVHEWQGKV